MPNLKHRPRSSFSMFTCKKSKKRTLRPYIAHLSITVNFLKLASTDPSKNRVSEEYFFCEAPAKVLSNGHYDTRI